MKLVTKIAAVAVLMAGAGGAFAQKGETVKIAMIEGLVSRIKAERQAPLTVIGTGGVASLFEGATRAIDHFDHDLTIRGLLEIHRRNPHLPSG